MEALFERETELLKVRKPAQSIPWREHSRGKDMEEGQAAGRQQTFRAGAGVTAMASEPQTLSLGHRPCRGSRGPWEDVSPAKMCMNSGSFGRSSSLSLPLGLRVPGAREEAAPF